MGCAVFEIASPAPAARVWQVGALCRAIADSLDARFNPVSVGGEISGFSRATSGHCYFSLKDESGQIRCAMFRRAAGLLDFQPRDGDRVEVRGRLGVYEPRGELQLVVESMRRAGQGTLFEQFLRLKAKLEHEGLFDAQRKRPLVVMPRGIGVITSLGAAALHDVVTALQRRVPHIPVVLAPAAVQGDNAPRELNQALESLYALANGSHGDQVSIDVILLVRGGGAMEDLWAFNDEQLARTMVRSPVPIICGVGHETDFTIADFVADLRAPTPTAAAELVSQPTQAWLNAVTVMEDRLRDALVRSLDRQAQRLDFVASCLGRPSGLASRQRLRLGSAEQRMAHAFQLGLQSKRADWTRVQQNFSAAFSRALQRQSERTARSALRLDLLDPSLVLKRGYAWLTLENGHALSSVAQAQVGLRVHATLADGGVDLTVVNRKVN
ncbi:MAG: exodeoxyribonuclease VII large subunit [Rhodoferax sp.]|nr:exodeoxyribonuclease VII large subunit [Rhodoferax sp.]MDP3653861.1 exodeoxyribonuclease VII large subunit [Rhodoferax sp.]